MQEVNKHFVSRKCARSQHKYFVTKYSARNHVPETTINTLLLYIYIARNHVPETAINILLINKVQEVNINILLLYNSARSHMQEATINIC